MTCEHCGVIKWKHFPRHCEENPPVTDEFPSQRPVMRSFDIFFYLRLNKLLSKQSRRWWFETPSRSLSRHCNGLLYWYRWQSYYDITWKTFRITGPLWGESTDLRWIPLTKDQQCGALLLASTCMSTSTNHSVSQNVYDLISKFPEFCMLWNFLEFSLTTGRPAYRFFFSKEFRRHWWEECLHYWATYSHAWQNYDIESVEDICYQLNYLLSKGLSLWKDGHRGRG